MQVALTATSGELNGTHSPTRIGRPVAVTPVRVSPLPIDWKRHHRQRSVESDGSPPPPYQPPSPLKPEVNRHPVHGDHQPFKPEVTQHLVHGDHQHGSPVRNRNVSGGSASPQHQSCPRLAWDATPEPPVATRRQLEFEAGLRRFGPNHRPQHSWTADDEYERHPAHRAALGTILLSNTHVPSLVVEFKYSLS